MAWGIFQKIGQGLKKAGSWVNQHIIQPVGKALSPIMKPLAGAVKTLVPGVAPIVDVVEGVLDHSNQKPPPPSNNMVGANGHGIRLTPDQIASKYIKLQK